LQSEDNISGVMVDRAYYRLLSQPNDPALRHATSSSVGHLGHDDLIAFTKQYWRPDLTTIAVVGDVTPAQVKTALEAAFNSWTASGPAPNADEENYRAPQGGHEWVSTSATQVYVRIGQAALSRTSPDYPTMLVINQILGAAGSFESRLWQEMRQKRGLVYSVNSSVVASRERGDFRIELNASPSRVPEAVRFVRDELRRLQNEPVTATELGEAKLRLVGDALLDEASADGQVGQVLDIASNGLPANYYGTMNDRLAAIAPADVQRVAKRYLNPDKLIEIFAGPSGPWDRDSL
jgi:zinc protease